MFAILRSNCFRCVLLKDFLRRNPLARCRPHVRHVEVLCSVIVVIKPAHTHPCADIIHANLSRNVGERPIAIIAVEVLPAEVIYDIKVGPAVLVVIAPSTAKTVSRVVLVQTRLCGNVAESPIAVVTHHEIRWAVLRVIIRRGIFVLVRALIIKVKAEINIQPAIAVIVSDGRPREGSLRRLCKLKSIRLLAKLATAFVEK